MDFNLPDPITSYNRQQARRRYQLREEFVQGHHPGFNLVYWQRIVRAPARVERWGRRLGWTHNQIMLTKALLISRMACVFIDHIIQRMEEADILPRTPGGSHQEWEKQYRSFLLLFLKTTTVSDRRQIVKLMLRLHRFTRPPDSILEFRHRHWTCIERVLTPRSTSAGAARLFSRRLFPTQDSPHFAARRICFTAALYSDIQERLYHQQWIYAYSDCMLRLYERIRRSPATLTAILELH